MSTLGVLFVTVGLLCITDSQFITFKEGRLGVNFGGYHAGVGLGGALGGGTAGGLFAEAGTPQGQAARAGLGGAVGDGAGTSGGLYADATAGGNVKAAAGLAGGVEADKTAGVGYAAAQAGDYAASSGLGGEASGGLASGFTFGASKSFGGSVGVIKESEIQPVQIVENVQSVPVPKKVHHEFNFEAVNEVKPIAPKANVKYVAEVSPPVVVKEVYVSQPVVEKTVIHTYKPSHKASAYIGGYVGGGVAPPAPVIHETVVAPAVQERIDVNAEGVVAGGAGVDVHGEGVGQAGYTKTVSVQRNPQFFADIFNIPIQTLRAVGNFLGNTAGGASVSVQKTASVQAESDAVSPKHASSQSSARITVDTSPVSKIIDDIFAIPINTLGAVNKFLENNVPARKRVQVTSDGEPTKIRLRPQARRRANRVKVVQGGIAEEVVPSASGDIENAQ